MIGRVIILFQDSDKSPIILRQCVWYNLSIHFVSRGLEFHQQLKQDSFDFNVDEEGQEYVTINHETQQKNFQGGLTGDEAPADRRMYATGNSSCPVGSLKLLMAKTSPDSEFLFNSCNKEALAKPLHTDIWYGNSPLSKRTFCNIMADISKTSSCSKSYTGHCLRATAIQKLSDQ